MPGTPRPPADAPPGTSPPPAGTAPHRHGCGPRAAACRNAGRCPRTRQAACPRSRPRPPPAAGRRPPVSAPGRIVLPTSISHTSPPLCRQSNSARISPPSKISVAAIGASALAGNSSSAPRRIAGSGRMQVTIDSALIPGSNTPKPPASKIQVWPGCHLRTSSFQLTNSRVTVCPASIRAACSTASLYCECHVVNKTRPEAAASCSRWPSSVSVPAGGFSSSTMFARRQRRACDGVAHLRRGADRHRVHIGQRDQFLGCTHRVAGAWSTKAALAGDRHQFESRVAGDHRQVLVRAILPSPITPIRCAAIPGPPLPVRAADCLRAAAVSSAQPSARGDRR